MKGRDARRRSAQVHARRAYRCTLCQLIVHGNGGRWSHRDLHERRGEKASLEPITIGVFGVVETRRA